MAINAVSQSPINQQPLVNGLEVNSQIDASELRNVDAEVSRVNKSLILEGRPIKQQLDKNDFLTLLVAQLKNQDPSNPVEDKQFIAQMAQFTTLEQMNNMGQEFKKLSGIMASSQAASMLGKQVDVKLGQNTVSGLVTEVTAGDFPQVLVNGNYYNYSDISRIRQKN